MKILVTGATGFIGYHVIHHLIGNHYDVVATATSRQKAEATNWFQQVLFVEHNITSGTGEDLFRKFGHPDRMIHLAWEGLPNYKNNFHTEKVLPEQYTFLENLIRNGLGNLTITGTCFEYGMKTGCLTETMIPEPANPYARAKNELRKKLMELQDIHPYSLRWIRLFYMYGKGQNPGSLMAQLDTAIDKHEPVFNMSGGQQVRDYLPVEEVAKNIVSIAVQDKVTGVVNCCSNKPVKILDLVKDHIAKKGSPIRLNPGYYPYPDYEPMEFWGDDSKLKRALSADIKSNSNNKTTRTGS